MLDEKRKFKRIASNVRVGFSKQRIDKDSEEYFQGVAEDCGLSGMFLTTDHLMPKGSVISLNFQFKDEVGETIQIQAQAVVRWTQRFRRPKGMGLEFFEFQGLKNRSFEECLKLLLKD
ncbi:MAG: PilZ domain-containing protein [Desulfocapsa sp.]|nr:PilZ domain-containing protein [Desulfocapsa sp.]